MIKDCGTLLIDMVNQNVDDGPDIARLFTLVLENRGFEVDTFDDPLQALSNFRPNSYDLVVLDIAHCQI
jgi:DNA-binding response OmpR family regulator